LCPKRGAKEEQTEENHLAHRDPSDLLGRAALIAPADAARRTPAIAGTDSGSENGTSAISLRRDPDPDHATRRAAVPGPTLRPLDGDDGVGVVHELIEAQLAHTVRDPLGRAYNRTSYLEDRRRMMQEWADYLEGLKNETIRLGSAA